MNKSLKNRIGASVLIAVFAVAANAQSTGIAGFSARLGAYFPTNKSTEDIGKTWMSGGIDYKLDSISIGAPGSANPAYLSLSADYYAHNSTSNVPFAINYNYRMGQIVWSVGAGVDFFKLNTTDDSGTRLGAQVGVSYDVTQVGKSNPIFLQAKYFLAGKSELNGVGVYVGVRF